MPVHKDAVGYLNGLREERSEEWFKFACDLALVAMDQTLSAPMKDKLVSYFRGSETYQLAASNAPPSTAPIPATPRPSGGRRLKGLTNFKNFKRLAPTLSISFEKRISLIFGPNGSGKSSICEAIKLLASSVRSESPLNNVLKDNGTSPSFTFQFEDHGSPITWTNPDATGTHSERIKYFDSTIAIRHISDPLTPESVVEVSPFRLEVFEYCRQYVSSLQDHVDRRIKELESLLQNQIAAFAAIFEEIGSLDKASILALSAGSCEALRREMAAFTPLCTNEETIDRENKNALKRLNEANTEQGLRLLRTESAAFHKLHATAKNFHDLCERFSLDRYNESVTELASKREAQRAIASSILPPAVAMEAFKVFLQTAQSVFAYPGTAGEPCPFCESSLDSASILLIEKYHSFLVDALQAKIVELEHVVAEYTSTLNEIKVFSYDIDNTPASALAEEYGQSLITRIMAIQNSIPDSYLHESLLAINEFENYRSLAPVIGELSAEAERCERAIAVAALSKLDRDNESARLSRYIMTHLYKQLFANSLNEFQLFFAQHDENADLKERVNATGFTGLLRRMTVVGKEAHRELVVAGFKDALDIEYRALSGKGLARYGIKLVSRGEQQSVRVDTKIGQSSIKRVLSEGEQKIHALALFFCEVTARPCDVFVFDDPSTCFDFNHLEFFVERLRELARQLPHSQIIIFTHNWDLFIQAQLILNKANLNHHMEVKVLEHCAIVRTYSENLVELKRKR